MPRAPIEYRDASPQVRAVFDDIKRTRQVDDANNFWKYLAHDPATLIRTWQSVKEIMAPGALDPLTKEMIYFFVLKFKSTKSTLIQQVINQAA